MYKSCGDPHLVDADRRETIAREFSQWLVTQYSVGMTTGVHGGGKNGRNDHMRVMTTTRAIGPEGWHSHKIRQFSVKSGMPNPEVIKVREQVAAIINRAFAEAGHADRVDHWRKERRLRPAIDKRVAA